MANKKTPAVKMELSTPVLRAAYNAWAAAKTARDEAQAAMDEASAILGPAFEEAGATVATVAQTPVLRFVHSNRVTYDPAILYKLAPKAADKARRESPFSYIRKA